MWLSSQITIFLSYSDPGAKMVFGEDIFDWFTFAFRALPAIIFFSSAVNVVYYLGIVQKAISGMSWLMYITVGISGAESVSAVVNILLGQTEAALVIRPYLINMSQSEITTVMTVSFATISSSVLTLLESYGVSSRELLAASVMSAPAAVAVSKIILPETELGLSPSEERNSLLNETEPINFLDATITGAVKSIQVVANIAVVLITFTGAVEFANNCLGYLGERVGLVEDDKLSFARLCGWVFYPMSWMLGVSGKDCFQMGELIGYRMFASELVAFKEMMCMHESNTFGDHSFHVATYALCGFSSLGAIGIQIGSLMPLAPARRKDIITVAFRAMLAGNIACFMTACVAGILTDEIVIEEFDIECSD